MDWFKRKNQGGAPGAPPPKSSSPPPNVTETVASTPEVSEEPTAEQRLQVAEKEFKETIGEYVRKLESLASVVFEKSEENEQLMEKLRVQEEDMKVLLDKMVAQEKDLETYKENQVEYKRRLEVLTDCLEDLARENMKLAARGAPASIPDDYEEERMPTRQEVQIQKTKSEVAAETAAKSVPTKSGSRSLQPSAPPPLTVNPKQDSSSSAPSVEPSSGTQASAPVSHSQSNQRSTYNPNSVSVVHNEPKETADKTNKNDTAPRRPSTPAGGLVLPSKSKSKPDVRDSSPSSSSSTSTPKMSAKGENSHSSKHKRAPSNENDFSGMASDPESLMVVLKKYKSQADSLRRDLIREKQKSESLQLSVDKYEAKMSIADKSFRDNLLKEAKRRKDAEYIANVLKKRVTELQFLLDEKDDSDHDSDSDSDSDKKNDKRDDEEEE